MNHLRRIHWCLALIGGLPWIPAISAAQTGFWKNDWTVQQSPALQWHSYADELGPGDYYQLQAPLVVSSDGDVLLRTPSPGHMGDQIVRFTSTGAVRWRVNLGAYYLDSDLFFGSMLPYADGSAIVAVKGGEGLARIDASGGITWLDLIGTRLLASSSSQVVVLNCSEIVALDPLSGRINWHVSLTDHLGYCRSSELGLVADASGNFFASQVNSADGSPPAYDNRVLKFDPNGQLLWEQKNTDFAERVLGTGSGNVYLTRTGNSIAWQLRALNSSDGSLRWSDDHIEGLGMAGSPAEVIAKTSTGVERVSALDGLARWTQSISDNIQGFDVFIAGTASTVTIGRTRLNANTGAIDWTADLPTVDAQGKRLAIFGGGVLSDGTTVVAQWMFGNAPTIEQIAPPILHMINPNSGAVSGQLAVPAGPQTVDAYGFAADPQTTIGFTELPNGSGLEIHVRAINAADGSQRWETTDSLTSFVEPSLYVGLAASNSTVFASLAQGDTGWSQTSSDGLWVGAFDLSTGAKLWDKLLIDPLYPQHKTVSYDPVVDASGNVFVSYGDQVACNENNWPPATCTQYSVVKLNGADGSVMWRHDAIQSSIVTYVEPPHFSLIGSDVLIAGPFTGDYASSSLLKLSGQDGSALWSSAFNYESSDGNSYLKIFPSDDGNVMVFGGGGWGKLDAQTGSTLWDNAYTPITWTPISSSGGGQLVLPDGTRLTGGENASRSLIVVTPAEENSTVSILSLDQGDPDVYQSFVSSLTRDSEDRIWVTYFKWYQFEQKIEYLAQFDLASGTLTNQQALRLSNRDPLLPWISVYPYQAPEDGRLLAFILDNDQPRVETSASGAIDTTITANGNLSLRFTTNPTAPKQGDTVNFHLTAKYSGDAPITGARLIADFPWFSRASELTCQTHSASNCAFDQRATTVAASFNVQPGGSVDITGKIEDTGDDQYSKSPSALVVGPVGLSEMNTADNSARANLDQTIFADGFE